MKSAHIATVCIMAITLSVSAFAPDETESLPFIAIQGGEVLAENRPDQAVNPASVVKVGTSLWALDRLGAGHRYETVFGFVGHWDRGTGILDGDLVVRGGGDPDFQWENAYLVARELNRLGLQRVKGRVRIQGEFWFGWEQGVEKRLLEPKQRGERMGRRLIAALDPGRWNRSHENTWTAMCQRRGWDASRRPRIEVSGGVRVSELGDVVPLVTHLSNPLPVTLRRFNVYSNNDIVRIADGLGAVADLEVFVAGRLATEAPEIEISTASGERRNRMSVRQMTELVVELTNEAVEQGIELGELLPVIGCDPGATRRMFPGLAAPQLAGSVTCKTGTLTNTDGGVAVLAGTFDTGENGPVVFAIAAPRAGGRLQHWRRNQQRWVMSLMDEQGGAVAEACGSELPFSDAFAEVETVLAED